MNAAATTTATKTCTKCRLVKPLDDFTRQSKARDGRHPRCKDCKREAERQQLREMPAAKKKARVARIRKWRQDNRERALAHRKRWEEATPGGKAEAEARYRRRYPEKFRAHTALTSAVRRGKITKPDRCEDCGHLTESRQLHGHHEDYAKPLDVVWLCHPCHVGRHHS